MALAAPGIANAFGAIISNQHTDATAFTPGENTITKISVSLGSGARATAVDKTNIVLWWDPTSTYTTDENGYIRSISDQSGKGNNLTVPSNVQGPKLYTGSSGEKYAWFDGSSGAFLEALNITAATIPPNSYYTLVMLVCPDSSPPADPTQIDSLNVLAVLGGQYNASSSQQPHILWTQNAANNYVFYDLSNGHPTATTPFSETRSTCIPIGGQLKGSSHTNRDFNGPYVAYTWTYNGANVSSTASSTLKFGSDGNASHNLTGVKIGGAVLWNAQATNQWVWRVADELLRKANGQTSFQVAAIVDPGSKDAGQVPANILTWCTNNPKVCIQPTTAGNEATCTTMINDAINNPSSGCGATYALTFDRDVVRCLPGTSTPGQSLPPLLSGWILDWVAWNERYNLGTGAFEVKSPKSTPVSCATPQVN